MPYTNDGNAVSRDAKVIHVLGIDEQFALRRGGNLRVIYGLKRKKPKSL